MDSEFRVVWSDEAITNLEDILDYLERIWTEREVGQFKQLLSKQLNVIQRFPTPFPHSKIRPQLRKSVFEQTDINLLRDTEQRHLSNLPFRQSNGPPNKI